MEPFLKIHKPGDEIEASRAELSKATAAFFPIWRRWYDADPPSDGALKRAVRAAERRLARAHDRTQRAQRGAAANRLAPPASTVALLEHPQLALAGKSVPLPTMRTMTTDEIDSFVAETGFGILALADGNRAYGVPLFYGTRDDVIYFQTRAGQKSHYLYATTEACLTISGPRAHGEWASVQILGRLERIDALEGSAAQDAIERVPPPLLWAPEDERSNEAAGMTTFRIVPARRTGRYSQPAGQAARDRDLGYGGT